MHVAQDPRNIGHVVGGCRGIFSVADCQRLPEHRNQWMNAGKLSVESQGFRSLAQFSENKAGLGRIIPVCIIDVLYYVLYLTY